MIGMLGAAGHGCRDAGYGAGAVPTAVVRPGELVDRVLLTGALHPLSAVDLVVPNVDGATLAIRWMIVDGAVVQAGDPVLVFDAAPFTGKLQEDHATLRTEELKVRLDDASAALNLADKQLAVARKRNDRDKARLQAGLPPDLTTERVAHDNQLALTRGEAALAKVEQELAAMIAKHALEQRARQIELDKTHRAIDLAEHAIAALVVKAPRDGVAVIDTDPWDGHKFHAGELVREGAAIVSLPDLTRPIEVRADVIDVDDGRVALDMAGTCTLDGYPADPLPCRVETLAPVAHAKDPGSLRRSFSVTLALGHGDPARLRPGMAVKVELARPPRHGLVIPRGAVLPPRGDGGTRARVRLGTGEVRDVTLAACDAQQCAIASGLSAGDVVASEPSGGRS
jgi:multidrug resistance efflux pump